MDIYLSSSIGEDLDFVYTLEPTTNNKIYLYLSSSFFLKDLVLSASIEIEKQNNKPVYIPKNNYWSADMDWYIMEYNNAPTPEERNKVYIEKIKKPLDKLIEYSINSYSFTYIKENYDTLHHDLVTFIMDKFHLYHVSKGKSFGYYSIAAKNYLINLNKEQKKEILTFSNNMDDVDEERKITDEIFNENINDFLKRFIVHFSDYIDKNREVIFKKIMDKQRAYTITDSLLLLMSKVNSLESFNKKELYIYMREITGIDPKYYNKIIDLIKLHYKTEYNNFWTKYYG